MGDFYGTGIEIWAGFGPVWQLLRPVFSRFHVQNIFLKKQFWHRMKLIFFLKKLKKKHFQLCLDPLETPHRGASRSRDYINF